MLRSSSTWRSNRLLGSWRLRLLLILFTFAGSPALGNMCLPHLFEDGQRLHDWNGPNLFDISLILRQHEICRRPKLHPEEGAISLFGSSSVFGLHVTADQTFAGMLNRRWDARSTPLHVYNLGFVIPYQLKDALILEGSLEYKPDLIVYGITLFDFIHLAPLPWPDTLSRFFIANGAGIDRLDDRGAAGLDDLVDFYRQRPEHQGKLRQQWMRLRELGSFLRLAARQNAPALVGRWLLSPEDGPVPLPQYQKKALPWRDKDYECQKVVDKFNSFFGEQWTSWNILAYLQQVQRESGVDVVVFNVPIQPNPKGECYNVRYPSEAYATYRNWIREETKSLGLEFWDLHDLLTKAEFDDSIHPTELGHRRIADELARRIESHLQTRPIRGADETLRVGTRR